MSEGERIDKLRICTTVALTEERESTEFYLLTCSITKPFVGTGSTRICVQHTALTRHNASRATIVTRALSC